jgi:hypothetical protein
MDGRVEADQSFKVTVRLQRRPDGGLRAWCDEVPELVLSHSDPSKVLADIGPAIETILSARLQAAVKAERLVAFPGRDRIAVPERIAPTWVPLPLADLFSRIEPLARMFCRLEFSAHRCAA